MARKLKEGQVVNTYTIDSLINSGAFAISYKARDSTGRSVFLKQYKSPSCKVSWYSDYVDYQEDLKDRIEGSFVKNMAVSFIDLFEEKAGPMTYFQVFEFVDGGEDLSKILERIELDSRSFSWEQRVIFAKVMMGSIRQLHAAKIIHCDLKPENLQLFEEPEISARYRLKLIDMDFSILSDKKAPWHGEQGYVGTPGYLSPEHLAGKTPLMASDIFTCGLIMYELLAEGGHPYQLDEEEYASAVQEHRVGVPKLAGDMIGRAIDDHVAEMMYTCLSTDPSKRPTAEEVLDILNGKGERLISPEPISVSTTMPAPTPSSAPEPIKTGNRKIVLCSETGEKLSFGIKTDVGKYLCKGMGADSQFMDKVQFSLEQHGSEEWQVVPNTSAPNETILNGKAVTSPTTLSEGTVSFQ